MDDDRTPPNALSPRGEPTEDNELGALLEAAFRDDIYAIRRMLRIALGMQTVKRRRKGSKEASRG